LSRVARTFERLLEAYRRKDGGKWGGIELERATGGDVTRSYVTNLRKGRIENPGMDELAAMATAMGFSPCSLVRGGADRRRWKGSAGPPAGLAGRVERLFDAIKDPKTGETYTPSRIARMSLGDLTEEDVEGIRGGSVTDPLLSHVVALARVFGVESSYLVDGTGEAVLDREVDEALGDHTVRAIARENARLRARERKLVLGIVREFEGAGSREERDRGASSEGR